MRSSSSMMSLHCCVDSSRGSRLPDDDRQCTHARLHAYVSSHVRQIGASSPCSNWSTSRGTGVGVGAGADFIAVMGCLPLQASSTGQAHSARADTDLAAL